MSDTPRMDAAYNQPTSTTPERNWQRDQCCREGGKLERELATVTEERDELKSKYRTHHDEAERITNEICRVSSVCRKLERELAAVTEQRDRLAKALWSMLNQDDMSAIRAGILLRSLGLQSPTNPNEL